MPRRTRAADIAVEVAEQAERGGEATDLLTLPSGLVFRIKPVPPLLIRQATLKLERPVPPKILIEDKGVEEDNPDDPAYKAAMDRFNGEAFDATSNILLLLGTEIVSIPEGMYPVESGEWATVLAIAWPDYTPVDDNKMRRKLDWLRYYALATTEDILLVINSVARGSGTTEAEVAEVLQSFRDRTVRRANSGIPAEAAGDGDRTDTDDAGNGA